MATFHEDMKAMVKASTVTDSKAAQIVLRTCNLLANNGDAGLTEVNSNATDKLGLPALLQLRDKAQAERIFNGIEVLTADWDNSTYIPGSQMVSIDRETGQAALHVEPAGLNKRLKDRGITAQLLWAVIAGMSAPKKERAKPSMLSDEEFLKQLCRIYRRTSEKQASELAKVITTFGGKCPERKV